MKTSALAKWVGLIPWHMDMLEQIDDLVERQKIYRAHTRKVHVNSFPTIIIEWYAGDCFGTNYIDYTPWWDEYILRAAEDQYDKLLGQAEKAEYIRKRTQFLEGVV